MAAAFGSDVIPGRPVVLLGGLGAIRALGRAGVPVVLAAPNGQAPAAQSRYCSEVLAIAPLAQRHEAVEALARAGRRLAERYGAPLPLLWDNDEAGSLVHDRQADLAPHFALALNRRALAEAAVDHALFQALAQRLGLPLPAAIAWNALEAETGPVLARPKLRSAGEARVFRDGAEARQDPFVKVHAPRLVFHRHIAGTRQSFHAFAAPDGRLLSRRIRGEGDVAAVGRDIAARLGVTGYFSLSFTRSATCGRLYLFDFQGCFSADHELSALFAWRDPMPFVRHWSARLPAAFSRRVHQWLATAS